MAAHSFLDRVQQGVLVGDGAMGTLLLARGARLDRALEALVIDRPEIIAGIHAEYARAGADVITTHTFGANRMRLATHALHSQVHKLNVAAVRLAQSGCTAANRDCLIAGNVGPVGKRVDWPNERELVAATFREQISALVEAGVDLLLFETFSDVRELETAIAAAREIGATPIVASMSYGDDGMTLVGQPVAEATARLSAAGVDVIGANCSTGPSNMLDVVEMMRSTVPNAIFAATPNAGLPLQDEMGKWRYPVGPEEFAAYLSAYVELGARLVGGCCGTTPETVAAMRAVVDRLIHANGV